MVTIKARKSSNKNPPILSHEFIIQNHADIVSCVAMVFVIGLMVQITSPWAYIFIALQHNVSTTEEVDAPWQPVKFTTGWKDACAVFFYFLITIVMHAVVQEYILDKISKKLHLSKIKLSKFNVSSQLLVFYTLSAVWGIDIIMRDNLLLEFSSLWQSYPLPMSFLLKLFFIVQLAYWLHTYPELYFQRTKREEIPSRIIHATIGLFFTLAGYIFNFQHITVILLVIHYIGDALQHTARWVHIVYRKESRTRLTFTIANYVYIITRFITLAVAGLFYVYGLSKTDSLLDYTTGHFNIPAIRFSAFGLVALFQAYLLYEFVNRQRQRAGETSAPAVHSKTKPKQQKLKKKDGKKAAASEDDDLPEVDQETKKNLRSRSATKAK
ncbi:translocating chain-associated membrane protein 1 [Microplitis mediator]|uniref:translocating chain-associated membrane protein 1 n=1 Tax=Microplitis mediator TaxID=375433 RepID=UPI0025554CC7|nr:translocating chain-associated membrane protein 1 [Microplitis mediator]